MPRFWVICSASEWILLQQTLNLPAKAGRRDCRHALGFQNQDSLNTALLSAQTLRSHLREISWNTLQHQGQLLLLSEMTKMRLLQSLSTCILFLLTLLIFGEETCSPIRCMLKDLQGSRLILSI